MSDRLRAAAQAALESLESRCGTNADERGPGGAITALRAALAEQEDAKPVAWMARHGAGMDITTWKDRAEEWGRYWRVTPLYTAPPRREWQSLTEDEAENILTSWMVFNSNDKSFDLVLAVEAALKEKNHD